ncbi:hypothetical protein NE235_24820 [Actinoallomurus spadix]|uniref:Uncharacterized protein n=1 Tax=Actinoallomurus spadix TaxID=79912 RepID=A0ABN0WGI0_9ACTN|nr:hypothetical protein [Actinoallomurus spadix]MCO5989333.1 hypothetical protein [Actinoallomurus spadix]
MATQIWRRRRESAAETTAPAGAVSGARTRRWDTTRVRRFQRHDGLSAFVWLAAWTITLVLLFGIALTWGGANQANNVVHGVMRAGTWLASPFDDVFRNDDARKQLTENWLFAAGVYLVAGRVLAWLLRW